MINLIALVPNCATIFGGAFFCAILSIMTQHNDKTPPLILTPHNWHDYRLLDSGAGRKLEIVKNYRFIRPEPQALWQPHLDPQIWEDNIAGEFIAGAEEGGKWVLNKNLPEQWSCQFDNIRFFAMPTPFRHFGFFPEQSSHWRWCAEHIKKHCAKTNTPPRILNLFGYTGVASLHAAKAGAEVTHVDASKKAIFQAFANRDHANMHDAPIRYITEDARSFCAREARRGRRYHGIILDPPKYGRGTKGEVWRMQDDIAPLLATLKNLLADEPLFIVLTSYAIRASFLALHHLLADACAELGGSVQSGELAIQEHRHDAGHERGRRIGQAIFARWQSNPD